jgi:hypothetical protein
MIAILSPQGVEETLFRRGAAVMNAVDRLRFDSIVPEVLCEEPVHGLATRGRKAAAFRVIEQVSLEEDALRGKPDEEVLVGVRVPPGVPDLE